MIRVVIDTSVLIRYLIRPSAEIARLIEEFWLQGQIRVVTAPEFIAELHSVLMRPKIQQGLRAGNVRIVTLYQAITELNQP